MLSEEAESWVWLSSVSLNILNSMVLIVSSRFPAFFRLRL